MTAGATITLTWEKTPLDAGRYDFILYTDSGVALAGSDHASADGVAVSWLVPEGLAEAQVRALAYLLDGRVVPSGWSGYIYTWER